MTILFLSRFFYPHIGGVEKHTREVAKRLIKKGHSVVVLTEQLNDSNHLTKKIDGIEVVRMPQWKDNWFKKFKIWWWLWQHRTLIEKADIVHAHDVFFWFLPFRFFYPKKPVFITFHGYETKFPPAKKAILVRKLSEKLSWGNICVGDYIKKWYGTKADYITYGGVNFDKTQSYNSPPKAGPPLAEKLKILFIGRLEKDTGINTYLKTLQILKNNGIDFEFVVCGDGSLRKQVEKYGRIYGFVGNLSSYLTRSNVVFSSSYLSIFEAMVNKKLIFAVYENQLKKDYLQNSPFAKWIIIDKSPKILAKKIIYYLSHKSDREKLIDRSHRWVKNQTWDEVAKIYESFYRHYSFK